MAGVVAPALLLALLALVVAGCGKVDVRRTDVPRSERAACTALVADLPDHVADLEQRTTSGNPWSAAWGDPAIVLRCGVPEPADYDPFGGCDRIDGVGWYSPAATSDDQSADAVLTTVDREPRVELVVPAEHRPPAAALVDLARAVKAHTRVTSPCA